MKKIILFAAAVASVISASAEGYQVNTLSAKQLGMGHVGVSQKLNSESVWFNPAAAAYQQQRFTISAGVTGIKAIAEWEQINDYDPKTKGQTAASNNDWSTPLYVNMNYKINKNLAVGLNFNTPFGSSMNWGDDWAGAHLVQNISLQAYSAQPTISYKLFDGKLSVGAGLMITWGNFELSRSMFEVGAVSNATLKGMVVLGAYNQAAGTQLTDLNTADPAIRQQVEASPAVVGAKASIDAVGNKSLVSATLSGDAGVKLGVNVGVLYDINPKWSLGASYRSRVDMEVDEGHAALAYAESQGDVVKSLLAPKFGGMETGSFSAALPLPSTLSFGASFRPTKRWEFAAEFQWVQWSAYDNLEVTFNEAALSGYNQNLVKNYSNTMISRVGAEFEATTWMTARAGFYVDESPVASDYLNPETPSMTKVGYTAGLSLMPCKECKNFSIDIAYGYITSADPERMGAYPAKNNFTQGIDTFAGNYTTKAHTLAFGLSWGF